MSRPVKKTRVDYDPARRLTKLLLFSSGGVYFLISHVLGSRRGAAVGIIYVFGQVITN